LDRDFQGMSRAWPAQALTHIQIMGDI